MRSLNTPVVIYPNSYETLTHGFNFTNKAKRFARYFAFHGYRTTKQHSTLSWKLCSSGRGEYVLTWLPDPVSEWTLIPNNTSTERKELWTLIGRILSALQLQATVDYSRPWAIMRLLPNARRYVVARFVNRQDADDYKRYLSRFMPAAEFEVIFDAPTDEPSVST